MLLSPPEIGLTNLQCSFFSRVQQESSDGGADRNKYLVQYVDYSFDDFGGVSEPVYPGLCSVWRSLARSKVCYISVASFQSLFSTCVFFIRFMILLKWSFSVNLIAVLL